MEEEWWNQENQDDYDTRLDSMRIVLTRLWNEVCYGTDEHNLTFSDVGTGTLLMMCYNDAILLEIQELEETEDDIDEEPEEDEDDNDEY